MSIKPVTQAPIDPNIYLRTENVFYLNAEVQFVRIFQNIINNINDCGHKLLDQTNTQLLLNIPAKSNKCVRYLLLNSLYSFEAMVAFAYAFVITRDYDGEIMDAWKAGLPKIFDDVMSYGIAINFFKGDEKEIADINTLIDKFTKKLINHYFILDCNSPDLKQYISLIEIYRKDHVIAMNKITKNWFRKIFFQNTLLKAQKIFDLYDATYFGLSGNDKKMVKDWQDYLAFLEQDSLLNYEYKEISKLYKRHCANFNKLNDLIGMAFYDTRHFMRKLSF